jgi:hypothetical protein
MHRPTKFREGSWNLEKAMESRAIPFKKEEEVSKKRDDPVPLLLSMMAKQYWNILRVKEMTSSQQELGEVARALQLQTWNVKKLIDQVDCMIGSVATFDDLYHWDNVRRVPPMGNNRLILTSDVRDHLRQT